MTNGIILAGGRGSRMGPLAAQISKALVSIGQRPHLVHQIELLRRNGVGTIVVVTSPDTDRQINDMITRAQLNVQTVAQADPRGPVDALLHGLRRVGRADESSIVLMSDTYLDSDVIFDHTDWYGVNPAPTSRSFCVVAGDLYADGKCAIGTPVTIGAYCFREGLAAHQAASEVMFRHRANEEVGMAGFLAQYKRLVGRVPHVEFPSWMDVGDVMSLAAARQKKFISRQQHTLDLNREGLITKTGDSRGFADQAKWMHKASESKALASLVPRVHHYTDQSYTMEYVDLPTLAELWLYWPGRPDTWADIVRSVLDRLAHQLWGPLIGLPTSAQSIRNEKRMFVGKAKDRLHIENVGPDWHRRLNPMLSEAEMLFRGSPTVMAHGDLNFTNILFSLNTGTFKLVDPRGDQTLPWSYELIKLQYSWHGFAEITHGLTLTNRTQEQDAMDELIHHYIDRPKSLAGMACLFAAGAPLHPQAQRDRMLERAETMLKEALA